MNFKTCSGCASPDICARGQGCGRQMLAQAAGLEKLAKFGAAVLLAHRNDGEPGNLDGGDLQEMAVKHGVLEERQVTQPCGEGCACAAVTEFPTTCYFVADDVRPLLKD